MAMRNLDLPEGVLEEILSWVPPESLMRFKCVSKSWYALINSLVKDPAFVNKHLHNIHNNPFSSACSSFFCFPHLEYCSHLLEDAFDPLSALLLFIDGANGRGDSICGYQVSSNLWPGMPDMTANNVCHCNGIICVATCYGEMVLCNPAIKKFRTLPKPFFVGREAIGVAGVGFGYDSIANDYKAIWIMFDIHDVPWLPRAELYSMKSDSWREIGVHLQFDDPPLLDTAVFCKGVVYWSLLNPLCRSNGIVALDMADGTFRSVPLPDYAGIQEEEIKIAACHDCIALFSYPRVIDESISIRVWMMDGCINGVRGSFSWIKKPTIGPLKGFAKPWTFLKNDELLMEVLDEGLISYNLQTHMLRNIAIKGACYRRNRWVFPYVKSLAFVEVENNLSHEDNTI